MPYRRSRREATSNEHSPRHDSASTCRQSCQEAEGLRERPPRQKELSRSSRGALRTLFGYGVVSAMQEGTSLPDGKDRRRAGRPPVDPYGLAGTAKSVSAACPCAEVVCRLSNPRRTTQRFGGAGKAPAAGAGFPGTPPPSELPAGCGAVCWLRSFWVRISLQVRCGLNFDALLRLEPHRPAPHQDGRLFDVRSSRSGSLQQGVGDLGAELVHRR